MILIILFLGAVSYGFSNIFVTAPSPENLKTMFEFIISGLKALKYTEHIDFEVTYVILYVCICVGYYLIEMMILLQSRRSSDFVLAR
jgi:tRNA(Met) C34 N-acetyltransferase TmcA